MAYAILSHLQLNLCLCNVLLAPTASCNLLRFCDLRLDVLYAEVFEGESFDGVDTEDRVWLDNSKSTRHYSVAQSVAVAL